jgi:hypothetical protein
VAKRGRPRGRPKGSKNHVPRNHVVRHRVWQIDQLIEAFKDLPDDQKASILALQKDSGIELKTVAEDVVGEGIACCREDLYADIIRRRAKRGKLVREDGSEVVQYEVKNQVVQYEVKNQVVQYEVKKHSEAVVQHEPERTQDYSPAWIPEQRVESLPIQPDAGVDRGHDTIRIGTAGQERAGVEGSGDAFIEPGFQGESLEDLTDSQE